MSAKLLLFFETLEEKEGICIAFCQMPIQKKKDAFLLCFSQ
jgi:hypothetical protein